jgi:hypothetical protein
MALAAGVVSRIIIASAQFLAEVPVNEQGYPSNTVSCAFCAEQHRKANLEIARRVRVDVGI